MYGRTTVNNHGPSREDHRLEEVTSSMKRIVDMGGRTT